MLVVVLEYLTHSFLCFFISYGHPMQMLHLWLLDQNLMY
jgi:hypothetical protein